MNSLLPYRANIHSALTLGRRRGALLPVLALVIGTHALGIALLSRSTTIRISKSVEPPTATVAILPRIRDISGKDVPDVSAQLPRLSNPLRGLHIDQPQIEFEVARNGNAVSAAPSLIGQARNDMSDYVHRAALRHGEGATVVLRIEVLATGHPGRIVVDASSGRRQVDQAAIDYARTLRWNAGRTGGVPKDVWIRWGVRLQA